MYTVKSNIDSTEKQYKHLLDIPYADYNYGNGNIYYKGGLLSDKNRDLFAYRESVINHNDRHNRAHDFTHDQAIEYFKATFKDDKLGFIEHTEWQFNSYGNQWLLDIYTESGHCVGVWINSDGNMYGEY